MARVPEEELERLKREVSLERLAEAKGVALTRVGKDLRGACPFHDGDHEPSLFVDPGKNLFHCFGCGAKGSAVDWVMKAEGVSFRHAVELLRSDARFDGPRREPRGKNGQPLKMSSVRQLPAPVSLAAEDTELLSQVVDYYHATLKQSPEALAYLEERGLRHPDLVDRFRLGFANRTLGLRLPAKNRVAGGELRARLQELGVLRESGHEHFWGSLVIPILDGAGKVAGLYGRKITAKLREGTPLHLYLPGPHRGVFNLDGLRDTKEVILCEALIDALTFWCAGFANVTASYGTEGFTEEILEALKAHGIERVLIAYDRDAAGDRAAAELAKRLQGHGIAPFRVLFPKGLDANAYAQKVQPAEKSLYLVLRHAQWMGQGLEPKRSWQEGPIEVLETVVRRAAAKERSTAVDIEAPAQIPETEVSVFPLAAAPAEPAQGASEEPAPPSLARPSTDLPAETRGEEIVLVAGDRRYRVRGLEKNTSYELLRVNVLASRGEAFHVDTLDLYSARQRAAYVHQAAEELGVKDEVLKKDLGRVLLKLEELQDEQIKRALAPESARIEMQAAAKEEALELLRDPRLLERILEDFARCGVVGEETNKLTGYLAAVSRKLDQPLAVIVQSSSAAGKSSLMDAILAFVPEEERVQYSAMTGQSLFYMGEADLKHKVLAIVEEEGAERASYALKLLQSEGELSIASTGKDPHTGRLVTHEYKVEGPVAILLTTTAIEIDEELLNRCLVLSVDEDREQTRAIHRLQREAQTLEGLLARQDREAILETHRNAQRLLQPLLVANPFARELTFLDARTRTRRDHVKYLTLIRTVALLRQHQKPLQSVEHRGKTLSYIEVDVVDLRVANRLAHEVLGRSLDELSPQTRNLLERLDRAVAGECTRQAIDRDAFLFSRRWVREATDWTDFQVRTHLDKLAALEYVLVHRGGRGQSFVYELVYDGQGRDGKPFLPGLLDIAALGRAASDATTTPTSRGREGDFEPGSSPQRAPIEPGLWPVESRGNDRPAELHGTFGENETKNAHLERKAAAKGRADRSRTSSISAEPSPAFFSLAAAPAKPAPLA